LNRLGAALAGHRVTRIVVFRVYLHDAGRAIARNFPEAEIELDMDDLESRTRLSVAGSLLRMGRPKMALRTFLGALQYAGLERWVLGSYRKIWLATMEDGKGLARRWASVVSERPNRIVPPRSVAHPPNGLVRLLFVGTLNYAPNEEAVRMIMLSIVPQLRRRLSVPWRLCIVGRHASAKLVALLSQSPEVEFIPDAEDVTPWYELSHMVLVPLHAGGGTKLKTIEAFAHRRAVISTPQGMRGLHAIAHEHYLPARTPDQFVDAILSLATDSLELQRIASGGWALFSQQRKGV
jgi:glycosyltransferase involved in cell wall biosynthesis